MHYISWLNRPLLVLTLQRVRWEIPKDKLLPQIVRLRILKVWELEHNAQFGAIYTVTVTLPIIQ